MIAALRRAKAQGVLRRCASTIYGVDTGSRRAGEIPWRLDMPMRAVYRLPLASASGIRRGIVVIREGDYANTHSVDESPGLGRQSGWTQLASAGKWSIFEVGCRPARLAASSR